MWPPGSTMMPPVVLVIGVSGSSASFPIIVPPVSSPQRSTAGPPAASMASRKVVPIGAQIVAGVLTAPATVRYLRVTGLRSPRLISVSTLLTTHPTCSGRPPGWIVRPVAS
ncbi:MAG: hypothetical protein BWZ10_03407 [candidate division BRC1 bacterium ADurb.BinA364]|nr:MAG: hypothetical protein BWZ10_03407 [candidate division BRC1 bacterium ADurb.BinA364]